LPDEIPLRILPRQPSGSLSGSQPNSAGIYQSDQRKGYLKHVEAIDESKYEENS